MQQRPREVGEPLHLLEAGVIELMEAVGGEAEKDPSDDPGAASQIAVNRRILLERLPGAVAHKQINGVRGEREGDEEPEVHHRQVVVGDCAERQQHHREPEARIIRRKRERMRIKEIGIEGPMARAEPEEPILEDPHKVGVDVDVVPAEIDAMGAHMEGQREEHREGDDGEEHEDGDLHPPGRPRRTAHRRRPTLPEPSHHRPHKPEVAHEPVQKRPTIPADVSVSGGQVADGGRVRQGIARRRLSHRSVCPRVVAQKQRW